VKLVPVRASSTQSGVTPYSADLVLRIEDLLERARTGAAALSEAQAWSALAEIEALLRAHPELPQAAWLMAERHALAAELARTTRPTQAVALARQARVLEPERASPFGTTEVGSEPVPGAVTVSLRGLTPRDELVWNGEVSTLPLERPPGEHHVRVLRLGEPIWAGWVSISPESPAPTLELPVPSPCSAADLAIERTTDAGVVPYPDVACRAWAVARRGRDGIELALCRGARCGPFQPDPGAITPLRPPPNAAATRAPRSEPVPSWATIALVGAGTALGTLFVLWQTGAFSRSEPAPARWTYTGFVPPEP